MDISIKLDDYKLNVRTCAFIRCGDEILLCEHKDKDYYSLPGGHVKMGEDDITIESFAYLCIKKSGSSHAVAER